jgi:hypothetical protein
MHISIGDAEDLKFSNTHAVHSPLVIDLDMLSHR